MRVSDRAVQRNYLKYLNSAKENYTDVNARIASGCKYKALSENVSAGTRVLRTRTDMYKVEKQYDNVQSIGDEMEVEEGALTSISSMLSEIHSTKIVKAMQDTTADSGRETIANELDSMLAELLQFANTKYDQTFVFGGTTTNKAPFSVNDSGKLLYNGIDVDNILQRDDGTYYYMNGTEEVDVPMNRDVYMDIGLGIRMDGSQVRDGTGFRISYSGTELLGFGVDADGNSNNIYNTIAEISKTLRNYDADTLNELDTRLVSMTDKFRANLTSIGTQTSFLDTMETRLKDRVDNYKKRIQTLMGVDDAEEATNLTNSEYVLKAILQMGAQILPSSLMDYLR